MKVATAEIIRELDRRAKEDYGISGAVLMENAGSGVARIILEEFPDLVSLGASIICGRGNNGGDGFVIARHLANNGLDVDVFIVGEAEKVKDGEAKTNLDIIRNIGIEVVEIKGDEDLVPLSRSLSERGIVVDALLGTGLEREVTDMYEKVISEINSARTGGLPAVVSVDIPSGISADSGKVLGCAVKADLTCAFALPKVGELIYPGAECSGELVVLDISIPRRLVFEMEIKHNLLSPLHFLGLLARRAPSAHKGNFGHLLIISGSPGKTGAAYLSAEGALRAGAGLVTVGIPESLNPVLEVKLTEAMTIPLPDEEGHFSSAAFDGVMKALNGKDAIAVGPGLGTSKGAREVVRGLILESEIPMVIDADGLNVIACDSQILKAKKTDIILTPHPGEMGRLINKTTSEVQEDRIGTAKNFAKEYGVWVVLKGARTVISTPTGEIFISMGGNPGMASGGAGDVLTGLIGGFLSGYSDPLASSAAGVYIHAAAGDIAAENIGEVSLVASDILYEIPDVISKLKDEDPERFEQGVYKIII